MAVYPPTSSVTIAQSSHNTGYGNITITGAGGGTASVLTMNGTTAATWANQATGTSVKGQLHLDGKDADIVVNGQSMLAILNGITDRLAILQPKPELLEKYANLREAYAHYRTLEALLHEEGNNAT